MSALTALKSGLYLIQQERESVTDEDLAREYDESIALMSLAIKEIEKDCAK